MPTFPTDVLFPDVLQEHYETDKVMLELRIPETLVYFAGHFPNIPIVPGVVQIQWAVYYAQCKLYLAGSFQHMEVVKFKALVVPQLCLQLHLHYNPIAQRLHFVYLSEKTEYSSGRIYFY